MENHQKPNQNKCTEPDQYFIEAFVRKIEKICFNVVHEKLGNRQDLKEEVTSETLLRLWEYRHNIDFLSGQVWGLARKIAINVLIDIYKKGKVGGSKLVKYRPPDELPESYELPNIDYEHLLDDLLAQLSNDVDKIIVQKRIQGYKTAGEIVPFLKDYGINDPSAVSRRLKEMKPLIIKLLIQGE